MLIAFCGYWVENRSLLIPCGYWRGNTLPLVVMEEVIHVALVFIVEKHMLPLWGIGEKTRCLKHVA